MAKFQTTTAKRTFDKLSAFPNQQLVIG